MRAGNQGSHDSGIRSRTAWNSGADLRRRDLGYLVTRSAEASCQPAGGLRSAQERTDEGWQPERSGRCTQLGGATTHQPSPCGVPRQAWNPCFKRVGAELLDAHQGQYPSDESVYRSWAIPCAGTSVYSRVIVTSGWPSWWNQGSGFDPSIYMSNWIVCNPCARQP